MRAFSLTRAAADQNHQPRVFPLGCQIEEIVSIAGDHDQALSAGMGEDLGIGTGDGQYFPQETDGVAPVAENLGDFLGNVLIEKESHRRSALI